MAFISKMTVRESRNGDGGLFSYGGEIEVTLAAEELPVAFEEALPCQNVVGAFMALGITLRLALDGGPIAGKTDEPPGPAQIKPAAPEENKSSMEKEVGPAKETLKLADKSAEGAKSEGQVLCVICHTACEPRTSAATGSTYLWCPQCHKNRRRNGEPFSEQKQIAK
jgi:hypothetical protein